MVFINDARILRWIDENNEHLFALCYRQLNSYRSLIHKQSRPIRELYADLALTMTPHDRDDFPAQHFSCPPGFDLKFWLFGAHDAQLDLEMRVMTNNLGTAE
jgi:hypothetical protein